MDEVQIPQPQKKPGRRKGTTALTNPKFARSGPKKFMDPKQSFVDALNEHHINTMDEFAAFYKATRKLWRKSEGRDKDHWNRMWKMLEASWKYQFPAIKAEESGTGKNETHVWEININDPDGKKVKQITASKRQDGDGQEQDVIDINDYEERTLQ